ncbi:MAG TPA: hypothetical protein PLV25_03945 [Opitutales bacterium]|nr:hypothetical protein [Opitutales bacterium]
MHNHGDNDGGMKGMMWMMVICCAAPLLFILVFGAGGKAAGFPSWIVIGGVVAMLGAHFFMMRKPRGHSGEENVVDEGAKNTETKDDKDHSCCH